MRLEWWAPNFMGGWVQVDEVIVFKQSKQSRILLVESQAEWDMVDILQVLHGVEVDCAIMERPDMETIMQRVMQYSWFYTSWNPLDQNRY